MQCKTPYLKQTESGPMAPFPCGKCPICKKRRVSEWAFRLEQEQKVADNSAFLTFTYDDDHLPVDSWGVMNLQKDDIQKMLKKYRKAVEGTYWSEKLKYYVVGEYGSKTERPHYHMIAFNADMGILLNKWDHGNYHFAECNIRTIRYTLKYLHKLKKSDQTPDGNFFRNPQFASMSKGIGVNYLTEDMIRWHRADLLERAHCVQLDGKKVALPRYYRKWLYEKYELAMINEHVSKKQFEAETIEIVKEGELYFGNQFASLKYLFAKYEKEQKKPKDKL